MFTIQRRALAVLALSATVFLPQAQAQASKEISFGIIATESSANLKALCAFPKDERIGQERG